jgi:hypothetical protein
MKFKIDKSLLMEELQYQLQLLKTYIHTVTDIPFSPIQPITHTVKSNIRGIYYIVHIPTNKIMYIGQGKINERRIQHKRIFNNGGEKLTYVSKKGMASIVDSPASRKMQNHDTNLTHWGICWIHMGIGYLKPIEDRLIDIYNPPFNRTCNLKPKSLSAQINPFW